MCFKKKETHNDVFDSIIEKAKNSTKRIVLPEGNDERIIEAAKKASLMDLCEIIIIGDETLLSEKFTKKELKNIRIVDIEKSGKVREMYANTYLELRKHKGMTEIQALEDMKDPIKFACMMLYSDDADGVVAGACHATADVLRPAFQIIKNQKGINKVSSSFIMEVKDGLPFGENGFLVFADCGVIAEPTDEDIKDIALLSAGLAESICSIKPRVALLSYTSKAQDDFPDEGVQKMKRAYKLIRRQNSSLIVDGELQADSAIVPSVCKQKAPSSMLDGRANVLVFPNLASANIAYKLVQRLAGVRAVGPILQGLKKPVNDLSRGTNVDEIVLNIAITVLQSKYMIKGE